MHTILVSLLLRQVQRTESVLQWHSQQGAPEVPLPSLHPYGSALLLLELGRGAGPGSLAPHLVTQRRVRSLAQQQLQAAETAPAGGHVQRCQPLGRSGAGVEGGGQRRRELNLRPGALALSLLSPSTSPGHHSWNPDPAPSGWDPSPRPGTLRIPP